MARPHAQRRALRVRARPCRVRGVASGRRSVDRTPPGRAARGQAGGRSPRPPCASRDRAALRARAHDLLARGGGVGTPVLGSATATVTSGSAKPAPVAKLRMPDDSELADINPYDLMESEAARLE